MPVVANQYNIVVEQGATFSLTITYKDSAGAVINLTDTDARMEIREKYTSTTTLVALTSAAGGSGNTSDAMTKALTAPATNVYDLELVTADGAVTRLIEGKASVSPGVTASEYGA